MSCASSSFCAALDSYGGYLTYNGAGWSRRRQIDYPPNGLGKISCASAVFCAAVDGADNAFTYNGHSWRTWRHAAAGQHSGLAGPISCSSSSFCVSAGWGDVTVFNGRSWSRPATITSRRPYFLLSESVSCSSSVFCVVVDSLGRATRYAGAHCVAPDILGKTFKRAKMLLKAAGCGVGKLTKRRSHGVPPGVVLSQSPGPNHRARSGVVRFTLST